MFFRVELVRSLVIIVLLNIMGSVANMKSAILNASQTPQNRHCIAPICWREKNFFAKNIPIRCVLWIILQEFASHAI